MIENLILTFGDHTQFLAFSYLLILLFNFFIFSIYRPLAKISASHRLQLPSAPVFGWRLLTSWKLKSYLLLFSLFFFSSFSMVSTYSLISLSSYLEAISSLAHFYRSRVMLRCCCLSIWFTLCSKLCFNFEVISDSFALLSTTSFSFRVLYMSSYSSWVAWAWFLALSLWILAFSFRSSARYSASWVSMNSFCSRSSV